MRIAKLTMTLLLLLLSTGVSLSAHPLQGTDGVLFTYSAPEANKVFVTGDFNGWNATDLAMALNDEGVWSISVALAAGTYEYKFIVDDVWVEDPDNPEKKSDPFGGSNNLLVVRADGSVASSNTPPAVVKTKKATGKITVGAPHKVDGGIQFTYDGPSANSVCLAGTFNGWNATELPLTKDDKGHWVLVHDLKPGQHEYKLVVDGAWFADPENPDTQADPYGGANSLVTVGDDGQLVAGGGDGDADSSNDDRQSNTALNARLYLGGRYLTRMETVKNVHDDPRYRMQRPTQSVDLNFEAQVSEVAETYMRIRMDSDQNIIQNNIAGFLDEANLVIHPDKFRLKAFWNQESFSIDDLMSVVGDLDHPGTIGYDHFDFGKGSAGAVIEGDPFGIHTSALFANVHNEFYYNDPDLFDNTGSDVMALRFSKKLGKFEVGLPSHMKRELVWLDFSDVVSLPSTGIAVLDEHRNGTGDSSTWYETDSYFYQTGIDARYHILPTMRFGAQAMLGNRTQRFVTGNESGENNSNGALDLPFLQRDNSSYLFEVLWKPNENLTAMIQSTYSDFSGATADQRSIDFTYKPQAEANKNIFFTVGDSPAELSLNFSELELAYNRGELDLDIWAWHRGFKYDYAAAGSTVPNDTTRTSRDQSITYLSGSVGYGRADARWGHAELEVGLLWDDSDMNQELTYSRELIGRYERNISRNTAAIADVRYISYHLEDADRSSNPCYWAPFIGLRNRPIRNLELVLGYGVDPLDFSIDYQGRQLGRWWYRQNYLFETENATLQDAEDYLAKARVITLRAQFIF